MRNYIGLSCTFHDPGLAIVDSAGKVVFAEAAERYLQNKRAINCPPDDVNRIGQLIQEYCEPDADLVVAKTWAARPLTYGFLHRALEVVSRFRSRPARGGDDRVPRGFKPVRYRRAPAALAGWILRSLTSGMLQASANLGMRVEMEGFQESLRSSTDDPVRGQRALYETRFDHHLTHAAAACYSSPFRDAVCAVVDGYGEWSSTGFFAYADGKVERLRAPQRSMASLGFLYSFLCFACGFDPIRGEEWKVMGLAPYGKLDPKIYELVRSRVEIDGLRVVGARKKGYLDGDWSALGRFDRADVAFTGQQIFEELMTEILNNLAKLGISDNLVLTGGCALNSSMNGLILDRTPFKDLYVYCAPGDDGNAIGAALLAHRADNPGAPARTELRSPYLGSRISDESLKRAIRLGRMQGHSSWPGTIHEKTADLLAEGKIVGWVQGRAEFGPRALGNRSILADPRRAEMKDLVNERVKFREEFRPFAPSILHEAGPEYFEDYQESPYMDRTLRFRAGMAEKVPAVVHVNGTGRLQTVKREWNERYYDLIRAFQERTGVPIVLNTSFNVMGKPIVHSVEDALTVFYTSGLDALVIGDELIEK